MPYDIVIKGGRVIDPVQGLDAVQDVAVSGGLIAAVAPALAASAASVYDAQGQVVTPGLIDFNTHVNWGTTECVDPDLLMLRGAVTTNVDAGTVGARDVNQFRTFIVRCSRSRVLSYVNVSAIGMLWAPEYHDLGMLWSNENDLLFMKRPQDLVRDAADLVKGVTMRVFDRGHGGDPLHAVAMAKDVARLGGCRLMLQLHTGSDRLADILSILTEGDIISRVYSPALEPAIFDEQSRLRPEIREAQERGVLVDVGHGATGFGESVAARAMEQGLLPDVISSGIDGDCLDAVGSLPAVLSAFLRLGMSLDDVLRRATTNPARLLGLAGKLGTLAPGSPADVSVLHLLDNSRRLAPVAVSRGGVLITAQPALAGSAETWLDR